MKTFIYFLLLTTMTTLSCCEPDDMSDNLPPATMEGKNTFGCKINGRVFVPGKKQLGAQNMSIFFQENDLQLQAFSGKETVSVVCNNILSTGSYFIPPPPFNGKMYTNDDLESDCWHSVKQSNSKIIITHFDQTARIISGTFEYLDMRGIWNFCDSTNIINITDGRFDIRF